MSLKPAFLAFTALLLGVGAAAPARADQVHFTGTTTVDAAVIRDALQNILRVAAAREHCNVLSAVEASVLPADYRPPAAYDAAGAGARYERWEVSLCGRVVPFLLGFRNAPEGGTMFQIGYPYPPEAPAAASRSN